MFNFQFEKSLIKYVFYYIIIIIIIIIITIIIILIILHFLIYAFVHMNPPPSTRNLWIPSSELHHSRVISFESDWFANSCRQLKPGVCGVSLPVDSYERRPYIVIDPQDLANFLHSSGLKQYTV